jgi:hypothetical protein
VASWQPPFIQSEGDGKLERKEDVNADGKSGATNGPKQKDKRRQKQTREGANLS